VALTKLRSHFYQPGQTEAQIRGVTEDMLADLDHMSAYDVEDACTAYRRDPTNKFYPTPGQLMEALKPKVVESRHRLQPFNPREFDAPRCEVLKPIGQILREAGHVKDAEK
jgi:hypothetical protein